MYKEEICDPACEQTKSIERERERQLLRGGVYIFVKVKHEAANPITAFTSCLVNLRNSPVGRCAVHYIYTYSAAERVKLVK